MDRANYTEKTKEAQARTPSKTRQVDYLQPFILEFFALMGEQEAQQMTSNDKGKSSTFPRTNASMYICTGYSIGSLELY